MNNNHSTKSGVKIQKSKFGLTVLILVSMALSNVSCTGKRVKESPLPDKDSVPQAATSSPTGKVAGNLAPNSLAMLIIAKLKANIKAKSDLPDNQIDQIGAAAEKKIVASRPAGLKEVEAGDVTDFIDDLAEGALETMGEPEFLEMEKEKALKLLKTIIQSTLEGLKGNAEKLDEKAKLAMLTDLMKKIIATLDNAGFDNTEVAEAAEVSLEAAVENLDRAGILTETNAASVIGALIKGAVLGTQPSSTSSLSESLQKLQSSATYALSSLHLFEARKIQYTFAEDDDVDESTVNDDTGEGSDSGEEDPEDEDKDSDGDGVADEDESEESDNPEDVEVGELPPSEDYAELDGFDPDAAMDGSESLEQVNAAMYFSMLAGAVGSLNESGFDSKEILSLIPTIIRSLIESLGTAGVDKKGIEQYITFAVQGAIEGLATSGVTKTSELGNAMGATLGGVIQAIQTLGFTSDQFGRILGMVVRATVSQIDDLKLIPKADYAQTAALIVAYATQSLKTLGITKENKTQLVPLVATIVAASLADLDDLGLSDDDAIGFVTKATGAVFGSLDVLGFQSEDLAAIGADLQDDLKAELVKVDEDLFGDVDYSKLDYDADSDTDDETISLH